MLIYTESKERYIRQGRARKVMKKLIITTIAISFLFWTTAVGQTLPLIIDCDIWPPYQIKESGKITGYSTQIVQAVFDRLGQSVKIEDFPWKRAYKRLKEGDSDGLFSAGYAEGRKMFSYFPEEPIFESSWVMWARKKDNLKFDSLDDLKGMRIGVVRGYSYTDEFWKEIKSRATYEEVSSDATNFKKLNAGRIDYIIAELGNGLYILENLDLHDIIPFTTMPIKKDQLYILFNKKTVSEDFVNMFSNELTRFKTTAPYQALRKQYISH